ncbi:MAG: M48 family metalloprotease [Vicinamibacteraceae bacterium]|nr:M48 family metalloprotease [Vicinamibacteraceae bacterium]
MRRIPILVAAFALAGSASLAAFSLISVEQEVELGREAQVQARQQMPRTTDSVVAGYVERLGSTLARRAPGPKYPYSFTVANQADLNAFALPGGPVWVHRGVLAAAQNEAQVAGVMAHEIAHISERHAAEQVTKAMAANGLLGLLGAMLGNGRGAQATQIGAGLFANGLFLKFGRDDEREADRVGVQIMRGAGYDARGMIEFFEILRQQQRRNPSSVETLFSTHPSPASRIRELEAEVARAGAGGRRTSDAFRTMQRRLEQLPAPPRRTAR